MDANDKYACAELIQSLGTSTAIKASGRSCWRPSRRRARLRSPGSAATFREFVERCRQSFEAGQRSKHQIFPSVVRVAGERALAETNIVILVRQKIDGVLADLTSYARFVDRLERRDGRWAIAERAAIYERDRLDPVEPSANFDDLFSGGRPLGLSRRLPYMAARLDAAGRALAPVVHYDGSPHTAHLLRALRGVARRQRADARRRTQFSVARNRSSCRSRTAADRRLPWPRLTDRRGAAHVGMAQQCVERGPACPRSGKPGRGLR